MIMSNTVIGWSDLLPNKTVHTYGFLTSYIEGSDTSTVIVLVTKNTLRFINNIRSEIFAKSLCIEKDGKSCLTFEITL